MPKEFYTEKDIEDLFKRGIRSLQITDNVVLTELAYEKANRLGLQLISDRADNPPAAPVRPYLSNGSSAPLPKPMAPHATPTPSASPALAPGASVGTSPKSNNENLGYTSNSKPVGFGGGGERGNDIEARIRSAVIARLGNQVDVKLLDNIIHRVVTGIGLK